MLKIQYLLMVVFLLPFKTPANTIEEYLQIKHAIGKKLEFNISGTALKELLKKGNIMSGVERAKYYKSNLGDNNFSYFLFSCRRLPLTEYELQAEAYSIMMIANARGYFGQSICMTKDIEMLKFKITTGGELSGTCYINVLDTIIGKLCFTGKKTDEDFIICKIGILKKDSNDINDSILVYQNKELSEKDNRQIIDLLRKHGAKTGAELRQRR